MADRPAAVAETHSAVVFFFGDRAYKAKKPVDLGFLDFRSLASRKAVCHREVELNRRLSPDVYLGVADVTGPDGAVCDHLVAMRRMPPERRLSTLVTAGEPVEQHLWQLAHLLATIARAVACRASADLIELRCATTGQVADARLRGRAKAGQDPSDATPAIATRMASDTDPWPTATTVETSGPVSEVLADVLGIVRR